MCFSPRGISYPSGAQSEFGQSWTSGLSGLFPQRLGEPATGQVPRSTVSPFASRCLHSLCSYDPPPGAVARLPHPLGFLITVLLGSGPQGPCGPESKPASWERQNSFQLLAPLAHPGPDSGVGSLLGLILPCCPLLSSDELPGAGLHFLDTWQCLSLPPPSSWPQPGPLLLLSRLAASVFSRCGLRSGFIQKVRTFCCVKTASSRPRGEQAGGWLLSRKRRQSTEPPLESDKNRSS